MQAESRKKLFERIDDKTAKLLFSIVLTTMLCVSPAWMMTSTYDLPVSAVSMTVFGLVLSAFFSAIFLNSEKYVRIALLTVVPFAALVILYIDAEFGPATLLYYIKTMSFPYLDINPTSSSIGVSRLELTVNTILLIPLVLTSFALTRCRKVLWAVIPNLPFFLCSVALVFRFPDQFPCETLITAVILLLITHVARTKRISLSELNLLRLSVPILGMMIFLGIIYPQRSYDKNEYAMERVISIRNIVLNSSLGSNDTIRNLIELAEFGTSVGGGSSVSGKVYAVTNEDTDLSEVGMLDDSSYRVCSVTVTINHNNDGYVPYLNNLYLKSNSKDIYSDNMWTTSPIDVPVFKPLTSVECSESEYELRCDYFAPAEVDLIPYYSDFNVNDFESETDREYSIRVLGPQVNAYNSFRNIGVYEFTAAPTRAGDVYNDLYLTSYVNGTCLEVPEETRQALLDSGVLPEWYLQVLDGTLELSTADKIRAVTEYVRTIHPYDKQTEYPPDDVDFVTWFLSESETGFCVHYATAEVILLRMIGVPARYVEGYLMTECSMGHVNIVYSDTAHAWFETFIPEFGWVMGDSTPGNLGLARDYNIDALAEVYPEFASAINPANPLVPAAPSEDDQTEESDVDGTDESVPDATIESSDESSDPDTAPSVVIDQNEPTESSRATATPTGRPSDETVAEEASTEDEETSTEEPLSELIVYRDHTGLFKTARVLLWMIIVVAVLLLIARMIYAVYWRRRFRNATINEKIRAYYRYYLIKNKILCGRLPKAATAIAEKAAFSNEELTEYELNMMLNILRRSSDSLSKKGSWYTKILYRFL